MDAAITENQKAFLMEDQIRSSRSTMGLDTQLIDDGTYFVVELGGEIAGCGGWSRRATLYGSNQTPGRDTAFLDPAKDAARVRAIYTHPRYTRRGIGRLIMRLCEAAAMLEGFSQLSLWRQYPANRITRPADTWPSKLSATAAAEHPCP